MGPARAMVIVAGSAVLAGCASEADTSASTAAVTAGPDTYTMTEKFAPVGIEAADAERDTLFKANQFCAQKGRQFVQVAKNLSGNLANPYGPTDFTVTFKCLPPSDPNITEYPGQQPPSQPQAR